MSGNARPVADMSAWLAFWAGKRRAPRPKKGRRRRKKRGYDAADEAALTNVMMVTGPTGAGKTAAVYACASELGYRVLEMHAGMLRSGAAVKKELSEATKSKGFSLTAAPSLGAAGAAAATAKDLNLILFEDADIFFDADNGLYAAILNIVKQAAGKVCVYVHSISPSPLSLAL
jgi:hypothetical protein